jgi:hypothetical protein
LRVFELIPYCNLNYSLRISNKIVNFCLFPFSFLQYWRLNSGAALLLLVYSPSAFSFAYFPQIESNIFTWPALCHNASKYLGLMKCAPSELTCFLNKVLLTFAQAGFRPQFPIFTSRLADYRLLPLCLTCHLSYIHYNILHWVLI